MAGNLTDLFRKFESWRYGSIYRRATRNDTSKSLDEAWGVIQGMDERARDLEKKLELITNALNFGMIPGACKDVAVRVSGGAGDTTTYTLGTDIDTINCGVTFTPKTDVVAFVVGTYDVIKTVTGAGAVFVGLLQVDGVNQGPSAIINLTGAAVNTLRSTCAQHWAFSLTGKVAHTIKMVGHITAAGDTYQTLGLHTGFTYHTFPVAPF